MAGTAGPHTGILPGGLGLPGPPAVCTRVGHVGLGLRDKDGCIVPHVWHWTAMSKEDPP